MSVEKTPSTPQTREDGNTLQELLSDDAGQSWQSRCINGCCDFFPSRSRQHPLLRCKITSQNGTAAEPSKESGSRTPDSISVTSSTGISASQKSASASRGAIRCERQRLPPARDPQVGSCRPRADILKSWMPSLWSASEPASLRTPQAESVQSRYADDGSTKTSFLAWSSLILWAQPGFSSPA
jgi:hypothetical protein